MQQGRKSVDSSAYFSALKYVMNEEPNFGKVSIKQKSSLKGRTSKTKGESGTGSGFIQVEKKGTTKKYHKRKDYRDSYSRGKKYNKSHRMRKIEMPRGSKPREELAGYLPYDNR